MRNKEALQWWGQLSDKDKNLIIITYTDKLISRGCNWRFMNLNNDVRSFGAYLKDRLISSVTDSEIKEFYSIYEEHN